MLYRPHDTVPRWGFCNFEREDPDVDVLAGRQQELQPAGSHPSYPFASDAKNYCAGSSSKSVRGVRTFRTVFRNSLLYSFPSIFVFIAIFKSWKVVSETSENGNISDWMKQVHCSDSRNCRWTEKRKRTAAGTCKKRFFSKKTS